MSEERDTQPSIDLAAGAAGAAGAGLITQPRERLMPPAMLAEQQRAKSEIEAALTIAAARPRDEKAALDRILMSCQRPGLAADSQYQYARGGTDITGATIKLMEVIAQQWGNLEFGFRELARFPGTASQPGTSIVEAFSWDLQTNTRRRTQFTVSHSEKTKKGLRVLTDPRDVYEFMANQAQRRVRTCLENIIPRDIIDAACEQCDKTLKTHIKLTPEKIAELAAAFAKFGVTKDALETRIQRRLETMTPAQFVYLRKIGMSLRDGMSQPADWFEMEPTEPAKSPMEAAKDAMRKSSGKTAPGQADSPGDETPNDPLEDTRQSTRKAFQKVLDTAPDVPAATRILEKWIPQLAESDHPWAREQAGNRKVDIRAEEKKAKAESATEA